MANDYVILHKSFSTRYPQTNTTVKRVHLTIGNIIHNFEIQEICLDNENPWEISYMCM